LPPLPLSRDLDRAAAAAGAFAAPGEELAGLLATEPERGARVYLCAFVGTGGGRTWVALDGDGRPVQSRARLREAVTIAGLCELAEETAAGGDLDELRARLVALRLTESPIGVEEAEQAVGALQQTLGSPPTVATPMRLDAIGAATRRLEQALGDGANSPFAEAMRVSVSAVESLADEVEKNYKLDLS
jgi:hypothetical protein